MNVYDLINALRRYNPDATVDVYATGIPNNGLVDLDIDGIFGPEDAATIHAYASDHADSSTHGHGTASPSRTAPNPRSPIAPAMHREMVQDELDLHFNHHEDRHVDAATVHALLEIAEQLRLANLIALAQDRTTPPGILQQALNALTDIEELTHLRPDVAATLGIEPLDEQEQQ